MGNKGCYVIKTGFIDLYLCITEMFYTLVCPCMAQITAIISNAIIFLLVVGVLCGTMIKSVTWWLWVGVLLDPVGGSREFPWPRHLRAIVNWVSPHNYVCYQLDVIILEPRILSTFWP